MQYQWVIMKVLADESGCFLEIMDESDTVFTNFNACILEAAKELMEYDNSDFVLEVFIKPF